MVLMKEKRKVDKQGRPILSMEELMLLKLTKEKKEKNEKNEKK